MKRIVLLLSMAFMMHSVHAQLIHKLKADSVLLTNDSHSVELNLENSTKNVNGFLYNKGNGRTEFRKVVKLNDTTFIFGGDTLVIGGGNLIATNGITRSGNEILLGQTIGATGNAADFTSDREIPLAGNRLHFKDGRITMKVPSLYQPALQITDSANNSLLMMKAHSQIDPTNARVTSIFIGDSAGYKAIAAPGPTTNGVQRIAIGHKALFEDERSNFTTAIGGHAMAAAGYKPWSTALGYSALRSATTGAEDNTALGYVTMYSMQTGKDNIGIGSHNMQYATHIDSSVAVGTWALSTGNNVSGGNFRREVAIGMSAGRQTGGFTGSRNVRIGFKAGQDIGTTATGNVLIGHEVARGINVGDNKLYIANTNTSNPLLYGEFDNALLRVGGKLKINNVPAGSAADSVLVWNNADSLVKKIAPSAFGWSLSGNAGIDTTNNFIGTTDSQAVAIRTKNIERMRISAKGYVGIGTKSPASFLHIVDNSFSNNAPLRVDINNNGFAPFMVTNTNPGIWAGAGALYLNDLSQGLQYYAGSSTNGFTPSRVLIRSTTNNGLKISTDKGLMQFQVGTVVAQGLGDTGNVKMEIDSFGVRIRKADLVTYDTATYQTVVMNKSNGRIFKADIPAASSTAWALNGNADTNDSTNFIGTTDNQDLAIRTNNIEQVRVDINGNVGIGTATPTKKLHVIGQGLFSDTITAQKNISVAGNIDVTQGVINMNATGISPFINITGNQNGWPRIVITNTANTTSAGAGSLFLNSAGHMLQQYMGAPLNAFTPAGALIRSNGPGGMAFVADSGAIAFGKDAHMGTSEFARFLNNGNFGIGTLTPAYKLDVNGKLAVRTIDSTATAANILYQDAATGEIKKAAYPAKQTFAQTATSTISTDIETTIIAAGTGNLTIPASTLTVGKTYKVTVYGVYSTSATNPANMNFRLKLGSVTIASSGGIFLGSGKLNLPFTLQATFTCRSTGSAGTIYTFGNVFRDGDVDIISNGTNASTINTTSDQSLDVTVKLSDSSSGNTISAYIVTLEPMN